MSRLLADIRDQPRLLLAHEGGLGRAFRLAQEVSWSREAPIFTGMATSLYAWRSAGLLMSERGAAQPLVLDAYDLLAHHTRTIGTRPLFVMSRSGSSAEIARLCRTVAPEALVVGITECPDSPLGQRAQIRLEYAAGELAFSNTKSFLMSLCYALACAAAYTAEPRLQPAVWVSRLASAVAAVVAPDAGPGASIAPALAESRVALIVGRGHLEGVAQQAALDLQEGARIGAIPVPGSLVRHGPLELVLAPDAVVLLLVSSGPGRELDLRLLHDLRRLGARVVAVGPEDADLPPGVPCLKVPSVPAELAPMVAAVALQVLNHAVLRELGREESEPQLVEKVTLVE